jgi:hypothetical protein
VIRTYAYALPELRARRQLEAIQAASVPHMEAESRVEIIRELERVITGAGGRDEQPVKADVQTLGAMGITVEYVTTDEEG